MNKNIIVAVSVAAIVAIGGLLFFMMQNDSEDTKKSSEESTTMQSENSSPAESTAVERQDIVALAIDTESLSTLVSAVQAAGLVSTLQSAGPFTVFAPTNEAFAALPTGTLDTLLMPENKDTLSSILTYHVVSGKVLSSELSDGQQITTVQGETLVVEISNGSVYIVDAKGTRAMVAAADVEASNGVVHVIDSVLMPE